MVYYSVWSAPHALVCPSNLTHSPDWQETKVVSQQSKEKTASGPSVQMSDTNFFPLKKNIFPSPYMVNTNSPLNGE